jgi:sugar phosphate isomerase/epimerase
VKLAYMMTTPEAAPLPLCWHGEPAYVMRRVAEIGYEGIELQVRDPEQLDAAALAKTARAHGLAITAVSTGGIGAADRLYFVDPDPGIRRQAVERYRSVIRLAHEYGVDCSIGRMRGSTKGAPNRETAFAWFRAALEELLAVAEPLGVRIVLEPQARYIGDMLNTIDETLAFIATFGTPALVFEGDLHHQSLEERSLIAALVKGVRSGRMTYLQICDSNRLAPGSGHFNFVDIVETLRAAGYDGWLAMEFVQRPDSERCAQQAFTVLRTALDGYRA